MNSSHLTNIIPILICKFRKSQNIPIPICGKINYSLITGENYFSLDNNFF